MDVNVLSSIRHSKGFSRSVAVLIILALLGLTLERTIYYALNKSDIIEDENVVEKINRMAPHKARQLGLLNSAKNQPTDRVQALSDETKFARTAQNIKESLATLDNKYKKLNVNLLAEDVIGFKNTLLALNKNIKAEFDKTKVHIEKHQLAPVVLNRHNDAVTKYETEFKILIEKLSQVENATTKEDKLVALNEAKDYLSKQKFKRDQQDFDPNNLPFNSVKPNLENKPKTKESDFAAAGLFNSPNIKLAALGDFTYSNLPGAADPAYLAQTDEIVITDAIRQQAQLLEYDPVKIYHWVLNNIEWLPTWGSLQDADITLGSKKGNAMDIASLLAALLRASQIPARYVHGTLDIPEAKFRNWAGGFTSIEAALDFASSGGIPITGMTTGGKITTVRLEHIWVEAAIDYAPSRGAKNNDADTWVQMDASFKQYEYLKGLDVAQIAGIDGNALAQSFINSGTVNEAEGWVSGFDPSILQNAQAQAQNALQDHITNNLTNPTVGDVIGGRKTIINQYPVLPSSLQNPIMVIGKRYGTLPTVLQQKMTFSFNKDLLGEPVNPITLPWVKLNNHKITLSFKPATTEDEQALASLLPEGQITDISQLPTSIPAYLISVIPELKVDEVLVKAGNAMTLGAEIDFGFDTHLVGRGVVPKRYKLPAGSFLSIAAIAGSVSQAKLSELRSKIDNLRNSLQSANPIVIGSEIRRSLLGDLFYAANLGYYAQYIAMGTLSGLQSGGYHNLAAGTGSLGYEPEISYFFGMPKTMSSGSVALNKPIINIIGTDLKNKALSRNYTMQIGMLSSALEYLIPETLFINIDNQGEAISAVKALQIAMQQGQRIFQITAQNQAITLPNIKHNSATMDEIRNALNAGKYVITHQDAIQIQGWSGVGYIIIDPESGNGAFKISGGANGGLIIFFMAFVAALAIFAVLFTGPIGMVVAAALMSDLITYSNALDRITKNSNLTQNQVVSQGKRATALFGLSIFTDMFPWSAGGTKSVILSLLPSAWITIFMSGFG